MSADNTLFNGTGAIDVAHDSSSYETCVYKMSSSNALAAVAVQVNTNGAWVPAIEFTTAAPIVLTGTSAQVALSGDRYRLLYANGSGYTIALTAMPRRHIHEY